MFFLSTPAEEDGQTENTFFFAVATLNNLKPHGAELTPNFGKVSRAKHFFVGIWHTQGIVLYDFVTWFRDFGVDLREAQLEEASGAEKRVQMERRVLPVAVLLILRAAKDI